MGVDPAGMFGYRDCLKKCIDTILVEPYVPVITTVTYTITVWIEKEIRVYECPGAKDAGKYVTKIIKIPVKRVVTYEVVTYVAAGTGAFAGGVTIGCAAQCAIPWYRDFWESY